MGFAAPIRVRHRQDVDCFNAALYYQQTEITTVGFDANVLFCKCSISLVVSVKEFSGTTKVRPVRDKPEREQRGRERTR